jgi:hypothetical protein
MRGRPHYQVRAAVLYPTTSLRGATPLVVRARSLPSGHEATPAHHYQPVAATLGEYFQGLRFKGNKRSVGSMARVLES